jgi:hypothetical protein
MIYGLNILLVLKEPLLLCWTTSRRTLHSFPSQTAQLPHFGKHFHRHVQVRQEFQEAKSPTIYLQSCCLSFFDSFTNKKSLTREGFGDLVVIPVFLLCSHTPLPLCARSGGMSWPWFLNSGRAL